MSGILRIQKSAMLQQTLPISTLIRVENVGRKSVLTSEPDIKRVIESTVDTAYNQTSEILQQYEFQLRKQSNVETLRNKNFTKHLYKHFCFESDSYFAFLRAKSSKDENRPSGKSNQTITDIIL